MADDGSGFNILNDLQLHLRTAKIPIENLSTLAREGDERVKYGEIIVLPDSQDRPSKRFIL